MGIGGWYRSRSGSKFSRERGSSVMTMTDIAEMGIAKAAEMALDLACRVVLDVLGTLVTESKLGHRSRVMKPSS